MFYPLIEYLCEKLECTPDELPKELSANKTTVIEDLEKVKLYVSFASLTMFRVYPADISTETARTATVRKCHFKGPLMEYYRNFYYYQVKHPDLPCLVVTRWEDDERREQYPLECVNMFIKTVKTIRV